MFSFQGTLIYGDIDIEENDNITEIYPTESNSQETKDWADTFIVPDTDLFSTSTASMAQVVNSDKSPEEQLEEIKEMATSITNAIQNEMANLLTYALSITNNTEDSNRKKRSIDTPMDSTKLVWRLLKHIKSNNEYQNIAIEKMMSAQEIADKYGIEFTPDTEILSELAVAANEQAKELTSILKDACDLKNCSQNSLTNNSSECIRNRENENYTCPIHSYNLSENETQSNMTLSVEDVPKNVVYDHVHNVDPYTYNSIYNSPYETQIPTPPVSQKQTFYDAVSYNPMDYYGPYCSIDALSPFDDYLEPEPEIVGEEFEETISSKIYVDHEVEPGAATVNHVMTYTIAEKTHYRTPQIENLPQQMQYYFLLV
ncbi:PREDICTED: uncharacterized protein LOC106117546 [Papilio xuthus]|uniref:Uncharacterized protein LOC106117546 n=1 Tax=Papilio xuthus TaxID=66420 RepID=A0AAJ6Z8J1_PAPXU|nr:PREDICTED: uncharacterized protein LOC106117546 [Papilio xuthus]